MQYNLIIKNETTVQPGQLYNHHEAAKLAGITVRDLLRYWKHHIVAPSENTGRYGIFFDEEAIYRLRQAEYLRGKYEINLSCIQLIMSLKRRIDELDAEMKFLKRRL